MRADARRNRTALVETARTVFAERGMHAPIDEIARRAGVGNATMYRHFPTRQDLIVAVYADEVDALCARGRDLGLFEWLREFVEHVASKRELVLSITDRRSTLFEQWHGAMVATAAELVSRTATARPGLDAVDLLVLATGIAAHGANPAQRDRLLALVRQGIEG